MRNKQIHIFTDDPNQFSPNLTGENGKLRQNVFIRSCSEVKDFNLAEATNLWVSSFDN